ncbi:MAG: transposase [Deltaproteobacteria bacterium]|nr:MAG: transposase [Deltaproteobacteria bacterium]
MDSEKRIQGSCSQCTKEIAISNEFEIEELQMAEDQVNMFLGFPPKYSIPTVVKRLKGDPRE